MKMTCILQTSDFLLNVSLRSLPNKMEINLSYLAKFESCSSFVPIERGKSNEKQTKI